ncbi:hypothetical protein BWI97_14280 [Siphonobacter sp. BAB-5405]|uniref:hypothetical protein n=1 Tax=Siphonobacter sp. BAB-5405 TaxID=1864825 RepID=UPI000C8000F3|nr:hypothetical protein [Siphonobacter sp. BAB-5405]PMD95519.1 hypothetical protein BWI97_14280 [Siphonobacter sp. BAB-5405]
MKLNGLYQDGQVIAKGSFGVVYLIPFEDRVAAILENAGSRKFLARERLLKLVETDKTLAFDEKFYRDDAYVIYSEAELNSRYSMQGGWNLTTSAADGTYSPYTQAFTGQYIQTPEMLASRTQTDLTIAVVAGAVQVHLQQQQEAQNGFSAFVEKYTGWRF